jgi:hypothetical protein
VSKKDTRQRNSLPSVKNKTLGKELLRRVFSFTEGFLCGTRQRIWHSAKSQIPVVILHCFCWWAGVQEDNTTKFKAWDDMCWGPGIVRARRGDE